MIRKLTATALTMLVASFGSAAGVLAAGGKGHVEDVAFPFEGPFGTYDKLQLQRGLKVYTEVCAACHGLKYVPFRALSEPGGPELSEDWVRAFAAQFEVPDDSDEAEPGDTRPAKPSDHFPPSADPNAPDLSLMAKARAGFHGPEGTGLNQLFRGIGGPEYIYSLLVGYTGEEKEEAGTTFYENKAFASGWISMPPPLFGEDVEFDDGSPNDLHAEAEDLAAFLMWAAEPKMAARKKAGFVGVLMLVILASLLYLTNKTLWAPVKKQAKEAMKKG